jgi:hypothetical protein
VLSAINEINAMGECGKDIYSEIQKRLNVSYEG